MKKEIEIPAPDGYVFKEVRDGKIVFEKDTLPTSWEEYCDNYPITAEECFVYANDFVNYADKYRDSDALGKLMRLRDVYRLGWRPDWRNKAQEKYCIIADENLIRSCESRTIYYYLSFKTRELRDMFLANFRDLIEQAIELP